MFYVPLARELSLWYVRPEAVVKKERESDKLTHGDRPLVFFTRLNAVDASRATAEKVLKSGRSVMVYPGGIHEIFLTEPDSKEVCVGD